MNQTSGTRVFILGAGCSADCSYPLAADFKKALDQFYSHVSDDCPTIKQAVRDTTTLMESLPDIQTLDQLARHIDDELKSRQGQKEQIAEKRILDAI